MDKKINEELQGPLSQSKTPEELELGLTWSQVFYCTPIARKGPLEPFQRDMFKGDGLLLPWGAYDTFQEMCEGEQVEHFTLHDFSAHIKVGNVDLYNELILGLHMRIEGITPKREEPKLIEKPISHISCDARHYPPIENPYPPEDHIRLTPERGEIRIKQVGPVRLFDSEYMLDNDITFLRFHARGIVKYKAPQ